MSKLNKPIDKLEFWKERIDKATEEQFSVYVIHRAGWNHIFEVHKEIIKEHIKPTDRVLDAGCGYGRMAALFTPENYVGIDFSPDFIAKAESKYPNHMFMIGDLKKLKFEKGEFDWAFCVSIKRMVVDNLGEEAWKKMEKELKRVAKKVLILEYETPTEYEIL